MGKGEIEEKLNKALKLRVNSASKKYRKKLTKP